MSNETCSAVGVMCPHCGHLHPKWLERAVSNETATCKCCEKAFSWRAEATIHYYAQAEHDE